MSAGSPALARFEVARRFCGPPQSGNGGYVAGRLAATLDGEGAAAVRLFAPPALEKPLHVVAEGDARTLMDGDQRVAHARRIELALDVPAPPDFAAAERAAESFRGYDELIFPRCFVCGFQRPVGDGLRIFPGALADGDGFAAPFVPDASLLREERLGEERSGEDGEHVAVEFLWAALDCPGAFSFPQPEGRIVLLGEMQAEILGRVRPGDRLVASSWYVEKDGRKHVTGSALHDEGGAVVGRAKGLWIELAPDAVPRD